MFKRDPKRQVTRQDYRQFLMVSQTHYTMTYLADHKATLSHDAVRRYLLREDLRGRTHGLGTGAVGIHSLCTGILDLRLFWCWINSIVT